MKKKSNIELLIEEEEKKDNSLYYEIGLFRGFLVMILCIWECIVYAFKYVGLCIRDYFWGD